MEALVNDLNYLGPSAACVIITLAFLKHLKDRTEIDAKRDAEMINTIRKIEADCRAFQGSIMDRTESSSQKISSALERNTEQLGRASEALNRNTETLHAMKGIVDGGHPKG